MKNKSLLALSLCLCISLISIGCSEKIDEPTAQTPPPEQPAQVDSSADDTLVAGDGFEGWLTSESAALEKAKGMDRSVLILFTGSDWCPPCMMMEKEIFSTAEFKQYAADNLVLLVADFPNNKPMSDEQKAANDELGKKFGIEGFPTVVLINANGKKLWENVGYMPGGPSAIIEQINKNNQ